MAAVDAALIRRERRNSKWATSTEGCTYSRYCILIWYASLHRSRHPTNVSLIVNFPLVSCACTEKDSLALVISLSTSRYANAVAGSATTNKLALAAKFIFVVKATHSHGSLSSDHLGSDFLEGFCDVCCSWYMGIRYTTS